VEDRQPVELWTTTIHLTEVVRSVGNLGLMDALDAVRWAVPGNPEGCLNNLDYLIEVLTAVREQLALGATATRS
jgi:hypothetical protein